MCLLCEDVCACVCVCVLASVTVCACTRVYVCMCVWEIICVCAFVFVSVCECVCECLCVFVSFSLQEILPSHRLVWKLESEYRSKSRLSLYLIAVCFTVFWKLTVSVDSADWELIYSLRWDRIQIIGLWVESYSNSLHVKSFRFGLMRWIHWKDSDQVKSWLITYGGVLYT